MNLESVTRAARQNLTGEISITGQGPGQQVRNEGTLGSKIINFFKSIGEGIKSLLGFGPNADQRTEIRQQRQEQTHEHFKALLQERFGNVIGAKVKDITYGAETGPRIPLTGDRAMHVIDRANELKAAVDKGPVDAQIQQLFVKDLLDPNLTPEQLLKNLETLSDAIDGTTRPGVDTSSEDFQKEMMQNSLNRCSDEMLLAMYEKFRSADLFSMAQTAPAVLMINAGDMDTSSPEFPRGGRITTMSNIVHAAGNGIENILNQRNCDYVKIPRNMVDQPVNPDTEKLESLAVQRFEKSSIYEAMDKFVKERWNMGH
ncbi:hypothetical protein CCP4SC76_5330031 [Gammaproteobacteria bacterium]